MTTTISRSFATFAVVVIVAVLALFSADSAQAQCATITFTNNTNCTVNITFCGPGGTRATFTNITPGVSVHNYPAGFVSQGVLSAKTGLCVGNPGPPGCFSCITLPVTGSSEVCCAELCYNAGCAMTINPVDPCPPSCL